MYLFDMFNIFRLTQLVTTSKACWEIGVNLLVTFVTFMMDVDKQGAKLYKKIEKLRWEISNAVLTKE